jgi:alpha-ribazole phosphatase
LNLKKELSYIEDFREMDFGIFENMTIKEIKQGYREEFEKMIEQKFKYNFIDGESIFDFHSRVVKSLENIIKNKEGEICICAHAGVIRCIISHLISKSHIYHWNFKIDNCSITKINIENNFSVLEKLNDRNHL